MSIQWLDELAGDPGGEGTPFAPALEIEPSFHWFPAVHATTRKEHAVIRTYVRTRIGGCFSRGISARDPGRRQGNQAARRNSESSSSGRERFRLWPEPAGGGVPGTRQVVGRGRREGTTGRKRHGGAALAELWGARSCRVFPPWLRCAGPGPPPLERRRKKPGDLR
jgi:hypothetical protein